MDLLCNKEEKVKICIYFYKKAHRKDKLAAKSQGLSIWKIIGMWIQTSSPDYLWETLVVKNISAFFLALLQPCHNGFAYIFTGNY